MTVTGEMKIMDRDGDTKLIWDSNNEAEVENARRTFDDLKKKGYIAYSVEASGDRGEILREFNPEAQAIIMAPAMVGG